MAACEVCNKRAADGSKDNPVVLIRVNEKGVQGIFQCVSCLGGIPTMHQQETISFLKDAGFIFEHEASL